MSINTNTINTIARRAAFGASFLIVGGVAAVNSYGHMRDVALLGHQPQLLASTLPLSVDGLLLIASLAMAEDKAQNRHARGWARFAFWFGAVVSIAANVASTLVHYGDALSVAVAGWPPIALLIAVEIMARPGKAKTTPQAPVTEPAAVSPVAPATASTPVIPVAPATAATPVIPVSATPTPVVAAAEAMTAAALPVPVSPAPAGPRSGSGPIPRRPAKSPLTGNVLADRAPRV